MSFVVLFLGTFGLVYIALHCFIVVFSRGGTGRDFSGLDQYRVILNEARPDSGRPGTGPGGSHLEE